MAEKAGPIATRDTRAIVDPTGAPAGGRGSILPPTILLALVAVALAVVATSGGLLEAVLACGAAAYILVLVIIGRERTAVLTLMAAFATAPMYKGLAPAGSTATPTDGLLVLGFLLLIPNLLRGRLRLPLTYVIGVSIITIAGLVATVLSEEQLLSAIALVFWLAVMIGLPAFIIMWAPSSRVLQILAWSYVIGHFISWAGGIAQGHVTNGRHFGMTNHPNFFGQAALMSIGLLIYLLFRHRSTIGRVCVLGAAALCGISIMFSGSRAAVLVVAGVFVLFPLVERSALSGLLMGLVAGLGVACLPLVIELGADIPAIERLLGNESTAGSNIARSEGVETAVDRFWASPWFGDGLIDLFDIHNNFLEVLVGIGVVGTVGYLFVIFAFARPLFSASIHRRLCYAMWIYVAWGFFVPSLYDRSIWIPIAMSAIAWFTPSSTDEAEPAGRTPSGSAATAAA